MKTKLLKATLLIATVSALSACGGSSCSTPEDVKAKAEEMQQKFQEIVKAGDMGKIMTIGSKVQNLKALGDSKDPQAACDAIDEIMKEL